MPVCGVAGHKKERGVTPATSMFRDAPIMPLVQQLLHLLAACWKSRSHAPASHTAW